MQCGTPVYSIENGGAGAAHFGVAVGGLGCAKAARRWRWVPPAGARCPQPALPLIHTGNLPCCTSSGPRAHGCAEAGAHQPPRRRNSAVRGGSCRSAGQWRAPRPVSPGTATLMADARCACRPADALNELRPLRQRVSRAAGICLPAAAGCQRSSARRCRLSAARCRWPGRRSSSPTTHHLRT